MSVSVIIPAKNEAASLPSLLDRLLENHRVSEIIVVDDGSTDETAKVCEAHKVKVVSHPYSKGNGAAIKTGAREAAGEIFVFMDADGQHNPDDIDKLLVKIDEGFDLAIGSRGTTKKSQANFGRWLANTFYNKLASWMVDNPVHDLTSGYRAVRAHLFKRFLYLLPNGFSYPTTSTMAFYRAGHSVAFVGIDVSKREGVGHIKPIKDGIRFLLIIFKISTLYSPFKLFMPISLTFFLTGFSYYVFTFVTQDRFTNMSMLLFSTSVLAFLIGLVSEQITILQFKGTDHDHQRSSD